MKKWNYIELVQQNPRLEFSSFLLSIFSFSFLLFSSFISTFESFDSFEIHYSIRWISIFYHIHSNNVKLRYGYQMEKIVCNFNSVSESFTHSLFYLDLTVQNFFCYFVADFFLSKIYRHFEKFRISNFHK